MKLSLKLKRIAEDTQNRIEGYVMKNVASGASVEYEMPPAKHSIEEVILKHEPEEMEFAEMNNYYTEEQPWVNEETNDDQFNENEKPFPCCYCDEGFLVREIFLKHIETHKDDVEKGILVKRMTRFPWDMNPADYKPFECTVCKKGFKSRQQRKLHFRIHTGEKPYSCMHCKKTFSRSHHLKGHLQTHINRGQFACNICGSFFTFKRNLQTHLKTHENSEAI